MRSMIICLCLIILSTFIFGWMRDGYIDKTGWSISPKLSSRRYQPIYARNAALERESAIAAQNGDVKTAEANLIAMLNQEPYPGKAAIDSRVRAELAQLHSQKARTQTAQ